MTCVVVARSESVQNAVSIKLSSLGISALPLSSLGELRKALKTTPVCGVLLEFTASINASMDGKQIVQELVQIYPSCKFKILGEEVLMLGQSLESFAEECRKFKPRVIRSDVRRTLHLSVYLSADGAFKDAEASVTLNVSEGGCFAYSVREWNPGQSVWLRKAGSETVLRGTVCGWLPWGNDKFVPGINIKFDHEANLLQL